MRGLKDGNTIISTILNRLSFGLDLVTEVGKERFIVKYKWNCFVEFHCEKKELIPFVAAWMELESIMLSEISQVVRDKYRMISPLTGT